MPPGKRTAWPVPRPSGAGGRGEPAGAPTPDGPQQIGRLRSPRPPKFCPTLQDSRPSPEGLPAPWPSGCFLGPAPANTGFLDCGTWGTLWPGLDPDSSLCWPRPCAGGGLGLGCVWVKCGLGLQVRCPTSCTPSRGRTPPGASVSVRCPWLRGGADSQWPPVSRERSGGSRVTIAPRTGKRTFSGRKSGVFVGRP